MVPHAKEAVAPMTVTIERPTEGRPPPHPTRGLLRWLTSTDHKVIGLSYLVTSGAFFALGGLLALAMRTQLARPEQHS